MDETRQETTAVDEAGPETLMQAVRFFADEDRALEYAARLRWPEGKQTCPHCGAEDEHGFIATRRLWKCRACRRQFSIKVGTIFEDSPIKLSKWMPAIWMVVNCKNGISSYELARNLGVTQKTAWFMLHRIRLAMRVGWTSKMSGEVEADETFIGGKARNMHRNRLANIAGSHMGKIAVLGLLERHGPEASRVWTKVVPRIRRRNLQEPVRRNVEAGSEVFTDSLPSYKGLADEYVHNVINHAESYAKGKIHTNGLENFWSLLKRAVRGTYVSVEPFHLFRYMDEQTYRFNHRKTNDGERFRRVLRYGLNRRLTYAELIGKKLRTA